MANEYNVIHDCEWFFRSLRWTVFLGHPPDMYPDVECYIHKCLNDIRNLKFKPSKKCKLTPAESAALINLQ